MQAETNPTNGYPILGECEFALLGEVPPHIRKPEGPFGDHYGYYSLQHPYPIFQCQKILHRKNAIYPATVVGKPRQEDFYLGVYLQELLSPLIRLVMPDVADLWSYGDAGFHSVAAAIVRERYKRQCMTAAFRILGEGQLALTKFLFLTDQPIDLRDFKKTLTTILARCQPETDLFVFANLSLDTLDYTGPKINEGSRGVLLGVGDPIRRLPERLDAPLPPALDSALPFCPGCLVAKAKEGISPEEVLRQLQADAHYRQWPLIALVDRPEETAKSSASFLWTLFTRFNPAADLYANTTQSIRNHLSYTFPLLIDARMKKGYPAPLEADSETAALVTKRWGEYFPQGMEMGDGDAAHVY